jgi:hypothetical protein
MRPYGLTEWLLMGLQKHLLMSWFMGIMLFALGNTIRFEESDFAKGFKFKRLQWLNDG